MWLLFIPKTVINCFVVRHIRIEQPLHQNDKSSSFDSLVT